MTVTDLPMTVSRRDVKGMTELLRDLKTGHRLSVTFQRRNYGIFTIEGAAVRTSTVNTFMVGSLFIESGLKPEKAVQAIKPCETPTTAELVEDPDAIHETVHGLQHGDLVAATFEQTPHGRFTVTGVAVSTINGDILAVGSWFLAHQGQAAARLRTLTVLAAAGTHTHPVPAPISAWESDEPTAT